MRRKFIKVRGDISPLTERTTRTIANRQPTSHDHGTAPCAPVTVSETSSPCLPQPPPPLQQPQRGAPDQKEDCRDYLRTGRCKYGASCKYSHPANVQSGGGMKTPTEPLVPVRPNEPPCQYYLKHGTCKFGQTCKFNHPPQSLLSSGLSAMNGNSAVANVASCCECC